jgi:hypothetical protein
MGSKRQPTPPPAPDPRQIAQTDAEFNRIDQNTPFGSLTFSGPNRNQANLTLSPELQQLFSGQIGTDIGLSQLGQQALPGLLNEQFGRDEDRLRQTLANQGLQSGGAAFGQEFGDFNRRRGDAFGNLARDSVLYGGQEASRALSDQLGITNLQNQFAQQQLQNAAGIRGQMFGENQAMRGGQFNELASLLGLQQTQIPGLNNFFAPAQAGVGDAFALNQASQQNSFNQRSATARQAKGEMGDLLGVGASLIKPFSIGGK